jgi:hypothetical protein
MLLSGGGDRERGCHGVGGVMLDRYQLYPVDGDRRQGIRKYKCIYLILLCVCACVYTRIYLVLRGLN